MPEAAKRVALVGHCGPDSIYLRRAIIHAIGEQTQVISIDDETELSHVVKEGVDLLLFNRLLDYGFKEKEGVAAIKHLKAHHPKLRMMLVSNYEDAQAAAVEAGAAPGFGKRDLHLPKAIQVIHNAVNGEH